MGYNKELKEQIGKGKGQRKEPWLKMLPFKENFLKAMAMAKAIFTRRFIHKIKKQFRSIFLQWRRGLKYKLLKKIVAVSRFLIVLSAVQKSPCFGENDV